MRQDRPLDRTRAHGRILSCVSLRVARGLLFPHLTARAPGATPRKETEMQRTMRSAALALAVFCAFGLAVQSQQRQAQQPPAQQPPERFGERLEVREVLLDALVTDAQGNVIVGLDKSDFDVRENGKPVSLTGITFYSNRRMLAGSSVVAKKGIR